jgi:sialic acid synthase
MKPPLIICEIGCNHMGDPVMAREMVKIAIEYCHADVIKFQKRNPRECLTPRQYRSRHPNPFHSFGKTYGEHRERLELSIDTHKGLKELCEDLGSIYSSSVWDLTSAREIVGLSPQMIKVPSACNQQKDLLCYLAGEFGGEIHVSLGMTDRSEEDLLVETLEKAGRLKDTVLYACTSGYPVPESDVCLLEITRLLTSYANDIRSVGFSGHHKGIAIDIAAITLGANCIERHFTLDRTLKGTDHAASLEPDGLRKLKRDSQAVVAALSYKSAPILPIEWEQRKKLKRTISLSSSKQQKMLQQLPNELTSSDMLQLPGATSRIKSIDPDAG